MKLLPRAPQSKKNWMARDQIGRKIPAQGHPRAAVRNDDVKQVMTQGLPWFTEDTLSRAGHADAGHNHRRLLTTIHARWQPERFVSMLNFSLPRTASILFGLFSPRTGDVATLMLPNDLISHSSVISLSPFLLDVFAGSPEIACSPAEDIKP
eukprot:CAMPEP_0194523902 /NCGR_PEP_ID=MMETSP0253-20130528/58917_1 /TAXON_ID=2966 /ORGANISM="Noctiluca scintillans" /LENGTH=151 /DNA_ID=CAMNT_0039368481 /DNA_START=159 /DNA_END=614 /DNA_ORIENTATION=+